MKNVWAAIGRLAYVLAWPVLYFYLKDSHRTRIIVKAEGKILMVKDWLGNGSWKLPGGGIHQNEHIPESACRELYEETGITAQPADLKSAGIVENHSHGVTVKLHVFTMVLPVIVEVKKQKLEIIDIGWHRAKDLIVAGQISKTTVAVFDQASGSFELDS